MLRLERIQHKFFRFASAVLKIKRERFDHNYSNIAKIMNLPSIKTVFQVNDLSFIFKLYHKYIDCDDLLTNYVKTPQHQHNTRHPNIFELPYHLHGSPIYRPQKLANEFRKELSFKKQLPKTFTKNAKKLIYKFE